MAIDGSDFPETLAGTTGDDVINAAGGNDIILGSQGNDTVDGGAGTDRLTFTLSDAALFAAASSARSYTIGASSVSDGSGLLNTSFVNIENITFSTIGAGDFNDTINASGFNGTGLTVALGNGNASVVGSAKNDIINTGRGDNVITAGLGSDNIIASCGGDTIDGEGGTDRVTVNMFNTNVFDGATGSRTYTITSSSLIDSSGTLNSTISNIERITFSSAGTGDFGETVDASGFVVGGAPTAFVFTATTGNGDDFVTGTSNRDFITTGLGDDTVYGGGGDDLINAGLGSNNIDGGAGIDDVAIFFDNTSSDTLFVGQSGTTITTTLNGVVTNTITNTEYITIRVADYAAANTMRIDASGVALGALTQLGFDDHNGSDILIGSHGRDFFANNPTNTLGNDVYTGNGGADIYDYTFAVNGMDGDTITDFDTDDIIDLQHNTAAAGDNFGGLLATQFIGNADFSNVAGQYRYYTNAGQTFLQVDTSGDGIADETLTIANGQFVLGETAPGSNQLKIIGQVVTGTAANDVDLRTTTGNDIVSALGGNDMIFGSPGNDTIDGGAGTDRLVFLMFDTALFAPATGSRTYVVTANGITDSSGTINTSFTGIERINIFAAGSGDFGDTFDLSGFVSVFSLGIMSVLTLGNGTNFVTGSAYGDQVNLGAGNDTVYGGGGADFINASRGADFVDGQGGNDRLSITMSSAVFDAATGARTYTITTTHAGDSSGTLNTNMTSVERITLDLRGTGDFDDTVDVSGFITTASVPVTIYTGNGNNSVIGSSYADYITVGTGSNSVDAGGGLDEVRVTFENSGGGTFYVAGSGGTVTSQFGGAINTITGAENISIQGLDFNAAVTTVDASGLSGLAGTLYLYDNNGSNISIGHSGKDYFVNVHGAEAGNDVYTGNGGADIYDYTWAVGAMNGDTITDLDGDDIIDFQFNTPTQNGGGLLAYLFIGNAAFTGVAGQYRYYAAGGQTFVEADTNGDGVADETLTIANGQFALGETAPGSNQLKIIGTSGTGDDDFLIGSRDIDDVLFGQGGNDTIAGTQGADRVDGGDGYDQLRFQMGFDDRFDPATGPRTYTIAGNWIGDSSGVLNTTFSWVESLFLRTLENGDFGDTVDASGWMGDSLILRLGAGNDTVIGSAGNDDIGLNLGINTADAGAGYDIVYTAFDNTTGQTAYVTSAGGTVIASVGGVQVASIVNAEQVHITGYFASGVTTVIDASAYVPIAGVTLVLRDSNGSDTIIGSAGSDLLANVGLNSLGRDTFTGNGGADVFDWTFASDNINGDIITDLDSDDTLDFRFNDGNQGQFASPLLCNQFIGGANFSGVAGQYRYAVIGNQTQIQVDSDGNGIADQVMTIANGAFALGETAPGSNILHIIGTAGTNSADTLTGTLGDDSIYALGANDRINGSQGTDFVDGGPGGSDRLIMNMWDASLFAPATGARTYTIGAYSITDSSGTLNTSFANVERVIFTTRGSGDFDDVIDASGYYSPHAFSLDISVGNGDNLITGSLGNDRISTGFGNNSINGGDGYDTGISLVDASIAATVTITSVGGTVSTTANGVTNIFANCEEVWVMGSGAGSITLDASGYVAIPDVALILVGHDGSDIMIGSAGNDFFANITGQVLGTDIYTGNGGADIYDYTYAADSMNGDTITDFDIDDVIDMRFNSLNPGGSPVRADTFIGAAAFSGTPGEYRYQIDGTQTVVQVDSDGDMVVDQTLTIANGAFMLAETFAGSNILTLAAAIDPLEAVIADGYLADAFVFIDTDGDLEWDAGEAWTRSDASGNFTLNVNQGGMIVATGGINLDTGYANDMRLLAPSAASVVNPLTTLVVAVMLADASLTEAQAQDAVIAAFGLADVDLNYYDPLAVGGDDALTAQKAAATIASLVMGVKDFAGSTGAADAEAALIASLATLVLDSSAVIMLGDSAVVAELLIEALPGATGIAVLAEQLATEAAAIAGADTLQEIAQSQLDALLTGNDNANVLTGDADANTIAGLGGDDTLYGLGGNDVLDGGAGGDRMEGGEGDDTYVVDSNGDVLVELTAQGIDLVQSSISFALGDNLDNLELTGSARTGTGNGLDNRLTGNALSNELSGGGGNDILVGGDGTDVLRGGAGDDVFVAEVNSNTIMTKNGPLSLDLIMDFSAGDKIDLSFLDANTLVDGHQQFNWKGTNANKNAGDLSYKVYDSVAGAEKALGADIDGVDGRSPYSGPVTIVYGNTNGGAPDFALALFNTSSVSASDFIFQQQALPDG